MEKNGQDTTHSLDGGGANGGGKIGRVLERARRGRGLSLEEAERATKIHKRYLVGLEQDDYTVLPDAVYARGFLKTYANFLGLDGGRLSEEVRSRRKPPRERGIDYRAPKSDSRRPIIAPGGVDGTRDRRFPVATVVTAALAVLILAALIGALYYVGRGVQAEAGDNPPASQEGQQPSRAGGDEPQPSAEDEPAPPENGEPENGEPENGEPENGEPENGEPENGEPVSDEAPLDALTVRVSVEDAPVWVRVRADSETVYEQIAQPGFSETFEAERRVSVRAGNAGAVDAEVNGQRVGALGADGEVLTRYFTSKNAS